MSNNYIISDVHGCMKTLKALVETKLQAVAGDTIYFLGDLINKGPDSKGVVDYVFELDKRGIKVVSLIGNHEVVFLKALANPEKLPLFYIMGGKNMLDSFKVNYLDLIPERYVQFFRNTQLYIETDEYLLAHAGFNFNLADIFSDFEAIVGISEMKVDPVKTNYKTVIHGHTPTKLNLIEKQIVERDHYEICLDNGCIYVGEEGLGNLLAFDMDTKNLYVQECLDTIESWKE